MKKYKTLIKQCKTKEEVNWLDKICQMALTIRWQNAIMNKRGKL